MMQPGIWTVRVFTRELSIVEKVEIPPVTALCDFLAPTTRDMNSHLSDDTRPQTLALCRI